MKTKIDYDAQEAAMRAQGEKQPSSDNKMTKEQRQALFEEQKKKYFLPNLEKNKSKSVFHYRILPENNPDENGINPIKKVKHHKFDYHGKSYNWVCLKEFGQECPMCATADELSNQGNKEAAKKWFSRPFYIAKGIDRANLGDGVKFWRFNHHFKGKGDMDAIQTIIDSKGNITHPTKGRDLDITVVKADDGNQVRTIMPDDISPLSEDPKMLEALLEDTTTWKDIFKPKEIKQYEDIVLGIASYWDDTLQKYINPLQENKPSDSETDNSAHPTDKSNPLLNTESSSLEDDDLPF